MVGGNVKGAIGGVPCGNSGSPTLTKPIGVKAPSRTGGTGGGVKGDCGLG